MEQSNQPHARAYSPLILLITLLPVAGLAWLWPRLPALVPVHFSSQAGTTYGNKHVLLAGVLLPVLLYLSRPLLHRDARRQGWVAGAAVVLSCLLCGLLLGQAFGS